MNASNEDVQPMADPAETPRGGGRGPTLALLIGLVVCALLAVGAVLYALRVGDVPGAGSGARPALAADSRAVAEKIPRVMRASEDWARAS